MPDARDFDWFAERVDVARWNSTTPGKRDLHGSCPSCGSVDNLHISERRGRGVVHCFSEGCDDSAVMAAFQSADRSDPPPVKVTRRGAPAAAYVYEDEASEPLFRVVRREPKAFTQERYEGGAWKPGLRGTRLVPFRLPRVLAAARAGERVYVVEGEKDVLAVEAAGATATCNPMGAGKWRDEFSAYLAGSPATIIADGDDAGRAHAERVRASLRQAGVQATVEFPAAGKDVTDHLDAGMSLDELVPRPRMSRPLSEVERIPPEPLVDGFAHPTNHTILYGPNGKGKGVFAAWKIASRTRAGENVLILDYEGHVGEWRARLEDMEADLDRVFIALPLGLEGGMLKGAIWDQEDALRDEADTVQADWTYVDSVSAACGVADVTEATAPGPYFKALNVVGRPSVSIGHVTKAEDLRYPFGSMLWRAYVRMAWSFSGEGERRELVNRKTNDYPEADSLHFDWSWSRQLPPGRVPRDLAPTTAKAPSTEARAWEAIGNDVIGIAEIHARVNEDGWEPVAQRTVKNKVSGSDRFEHVGHGMYRRVPLPTVTLRKTGTGQQGHGYQAGMEGAPE